MTENQNTTPEIEEANNVFTSFIKFFRDIVIIFLIAFFIRSFIVTPFQIQGESMNDSYFNKEYILVNSFSYLDFDTHFDNFIHSNSWSIAGGAAYLLSKIPIHIGNPDRGDVVVLKPHVDQAREFYIKRIIGLPGDTVRIGSGQVFIKPAGTEEFTQIKEPYLSLVNSGQTEIEPDLTNRDFLVPEWMYWVMWDNRINSSDSRNCFKSCSLPWSAHFLKRADIVGKVTMSFGYFNIFSEKTANGGGFPNLGTLTWWVKPRLFSTPSGAEYPELHQ